MNHDPANVKRRLNRLETGTGVHSDGLVVQMFGCKTCDWHGTSLCPHGLDFSITESGFKIRDEHANGICSLRANWMKTLYAVAGNKMKALQVDRVVKMTALADKVWRESQLSGYDSDVQNYVRIEKVLTKTLEGMRRQEEGVKVSNDINVKWEEFSNIVEAQAKVLEDKDIIEEAQKLKDKK